MIQTDAGAAAFSPIALRLKPRWDTLVLRIVSVFITTHYIPAQTIDFQTIRLQEIMQDDHRESGYRESGV